MSDFKEVRVQPLDPLGEAGLGLWEPEGHGASLGLPCPGSD